MFLPIRVWNPTIGFMMWNVVIFEKINEICSVKSKFQECGLSLNYKFSYILLGETSKFEACMDTYPKKFQTTFGRKITKYGFFMNF